MHLKLQMVQASSSREFKAVKRGIRISTAKFWCSALRAHRGVWFAERFPPCGPEIATCRGWALDLGRRRSSAGSTRAAQRIVQPIQSFWQSCHHRIRLCLLSTAVLVHIYVSSHSNSKPSSAARTSLRVPRILNWELLSCFDRVCEEAPSRSAGFSALQHCCCAQPSDLH